MKGHALPHAEATNIALDRSSAIPLYRQLAQQLEAAIDSGLIGPGDAIGNEAVLAQRQGVSRQTMRQAILELVERGMLVRSRNRGTHVVDAPLSRPSDISSLFDELEAAHRRPSTILLTRDTSVAPPPIAHALGIPKNQAVMHLVRLRIADGCPLAIMDNYLPCDLIDPAAKDLEERGLYQILRNAGITLKVARQNVGARSGTPTECRLLQEPDNSPLLTIRRITHDHTARVVEYATHVLRASRYRLATTLINR